jgi:hypothetical protein
MLREQDEALKPYARSMGRGPSAIPAAPGARSSLGSYRVPSLGPGSDSEGRCAFCLKKLEKKHEKKELKGKTFSPHLRGRGSWPLLGVAKQHPA